MRLCGVVVVASLAVLFASTARADDVKFICTRPNGQEVKATSCRPVSTPSPVPTATPAPTTVADCSDGTFVAATPNSVKWVNRTYNPGQVYHLCFVVPPTAKGSIFQFNSTNWANSSCNMIDWWITSPGRLPYSGSGTQPGGAGKFETGKWSMTVVLDPNNFLCGANKPFDFYVTWF